MVANIYKSDRLATLTVLANQNYKPPETLKDKTLNKIINEGVDDFYKMIDEILQIRSVQDIFLIITKENRLFYFGIYIMIMAVILHIFVYDI